MSIVSPSTLGSDRRHSRHLVTIYTCNRVPVFECPYAVGRTLSEFLHLATARRIVLLAYCFVPDRVQLLVDGSARGADVDTFIRLGKHRSGYVHRRAAGQVLWSDAHHDLMLDGGDDVRALARRLILSPVRAGLARAAREYPHLGSAVWSIEELEEG